MTHLPAHLPAKFAPLTAWLDGHYVTSLFVSQRYGLSTQTLANWRCAGKGIPAVQLPGGTVRYKLSELFLFEMAGHRGPLPLERIAIELAAMPDVSAELASKIMTRLTDAASKSV